MLVLALLLAVVPTAAQAKGASGATISGGGPGGLPGGPINLKGDGEPGSGTNLANLAQAAGVWALLFEDGPGGELASAPATANRGPRYTITWIFPNGAGTEDKVRQSVWPYAAGGPLTFMASGQPVLDATTKGGWYQAADNLRQSLIALGLPSREPLTAPATATATAPATPAAPAAPTRRPRSGLGWPSGWRSCSPWPAGPWSCAAVPAPAPPPPRSRQGRSIRPCSLPSGSRNWAQSPQGWVEGSSVNSTPRRRSSSKVARRSSQANTSPGVNGTTEVSAPAGATSTQRPSGPIGSSRRFSNPSLPT
jgi:hypothetical protein